MVSKKTIALLGSLAGMIAIAGADGIRLNMGCREDGRDG
jgi:tRNA-dihydrouridine synthase